MYEELNSVGDQIKGERISAQFRRFSPKKPKSHNKYQKKCILKQNVVCIIEKPFRRKT